MARCYSAGPVSCVLRELFRSERPGKYTSGRSGDWLKVKCVHEQEFVIGGFTLPANGSHGVGALLLGYYKNKKLIYAGRTGTGFTQKTHRKLRDQLEELRRTSKPFDDDTGGGVEGSGVGEAAAGGAGELCYLDGRSSASTSIFQRTARG